jgi:hypothetical protein
MSARMITQVHRVLNHSYELVYCSYKRNNVNIIFKHAIESAPFELTKIIIKVLSSEMLLIGADPIIWIFITCEGRVGVYIHVSDRIQR